MTRLFGYTCPLCDAYHAELEGWFVSGVGLKVRCEDCGFVETISEREVTV